MGEPITRDEVKRAAEEARALAMPTSHARRPYDDKHGHSYMESDRDYTENNADAAVWALENAERIRAVPNLADHALSLLDALEAAEAETERMREAAQVAEADVQRLTAELERLRPLVEAAKRYAKWAAARGPGAFAESVAADDDLVTIACRMFR
jgi:DNA repair ATPase RecN